MKSANSFRELVLKGERFCAYPAEGVPDALWNRYPVRGGRRLAKALKLLSRYRLDRLVTKRAGDPNPDFARALGESCGVAYSWPAADHFAGRYYAYVFDKATGEIRSYVKFATIADDRAALQREVSALKWLAGMQLPFSIARVVREGEAGGARFAEFELLPADKDAVAWSADSWSTEIESLCASFAKGTERTLDRSAALSLAWVARLKRNCSEALWRNFERSLSDGMPVCATHGDMACHNLLRHNGRWWIFDWENLTKDGPELTDELTVEMCTRVFWQHMEFRNAFDDYLNKHHGGKLNARLIHAMAFVVMSKNSLWKQYSEVLEEGTK